MFEREIKFIYDFNLNKVNRLGPYFTFEQLSRIDIHPAILNYISAEIDFLIFEDRQNLLKNSVFDYSGEKISNYFNLISEEVKKSKRFSLEYISKLILHASSFTVNYLVRPKWTLSKFVFDESDHKTTLEIKQILNYIYYYQYLKKILISYINSKKIISMNSDEFINLLDRVDNLGIETYLPSILSNAIKSMGDFFNIGEIQKNKIPFLAIEKFLEEKKLDDHLNKIHSVFGIDTTTKVNILDLQKTLESVLIEKFEQPTEEVIEEEEVKEEISPVKEPEIVEEKTEDTSEEYYKEEVESVDESNGDDTVKQKKLRIRIDKNNEIEPVYEEEPEKIQLKEDDTKEEKIVFEEDLEGISEEKNIKEENAEESLEAGIIIKEEEIIGEKDIYKENKNLEEEIDQSNQQQNMGKEDLIEEMGAESLDIELVEQSLEQEQQVIEDVDTSGENESLTKDELHPDRVYDQIIQEEAETEESMLQTILQSSKEATEENPSDIEDKSLEDLSKPKIDVAELLEHKEMTKIIEMIFDYDIEEFANTLDEISNCQSFDDAVVVINQSLKNRNISSNSKEAEAFKSIISKYFTDK